MLCMTVGSSYIREIIIDLTGVGQEARFIADFAAELLLMKKQKRSLVQELQEWQIF